MGMYEGTLFASSKLSFRLALTLLSLQISARRLLGRLAQLVLHPLGKIPSFMYLKHFCDIKLQKSKMKDIIIFIITFPSPTHKKLVLSSVLHTYTSDLVGLQPPR